MTAAPSATGKIFFCDRHPHFKASAIADCGHFHRLCAQCVYIGIFGPAERDGSGDNKQIPCPICKQAIRNVEDLVKNKKGITTALRLIIAGKRYVDPDMHLQLPTELHVELMRFLDMESLRKMVSISRLPYAFFGDKMSKWNVRNEWVYSLSKNFVDQARQRQIFEISQHGLSVRSKENVNHVFANVIAKKPFKLAENPAANNGTSTAVTTAMTTIRRFYFEIRVDKSTGPILFGLTRQIRFDEKPKIPLDIRKEAEHHGAEHHHVQERRARVFAEVRRFKERQRCVEFASRQNFHFLANDIIAWPRNYQREWQEMSLGSFAERNLVPAAAVEKFVDGDVLGCGLLVFPQEFLGEQAQPCPDDKHMQYQLFFTRNGQLFGEPVWVSPGDECLFPFVGLVNAGTSVSANFGDLEKFPYAYSIGQHNGPIGTD